MSFRSPHPPPAPPAPPLVESHSPARAYSQLAHQAYRPPLACRTVTGTRSVLLERNIRISPIYDSHVGLPARSDSGKQGECSVSSSLAVLLPESRCIGVLVGAASTCGCCGHFHLAALVSPPSPSSISLSPCDNTRQASLSKQWRLTVVVEKVTQVVKWR